MKSFKKQIAVFSALCLLAVSFAVFPSAATGGIREKLSRLLEVYGEATYFTSDGGPSGGSQNEKCSLENIPARGGLPSGLEVYWCDWQGYSYSCVAFANYVYYYLFGCHFSNAKNEALFDADARANLRLGDYVRFNGGSHTAIFLWEDEDYYYVYDANGEGGHNCMVCWNNAFRKIYWKVTSAYHAYNYDEVCSASEVATFVMPDGSYNLRNVRTGVYLGEDRGMQKEDPGFNLSFTFASSGFKIAYKSAPNAFFAPLETEIGFTGAPGTTGLWVCEKTDGGMVIHNYEDRDSVLACVDGRLCVRRRTGSSDELWRLGHEKHDYAERVIIQPGCVTYGAVEYSCICGDVRTEELPPVGHTYRPERTFAATRSVCGFVKQRCAVCGAVTRSDLTAKLYPVEAVSTGRIRDNGSCIIVDPGVTEEEFLDCFPDYVFYDDAMRTGAYGYSAVYGGVRRVIVAGDSDGDGRVSVNDARHALRAAVRLEEPTVYEITSSDWDGDGSLTVTDARYELRLAIGMENANTLFVRIK